MILLDSSILVEYLRSPSPSIRARLLSGQPVVCGVVRAEILAGARSEAELGKLAEALDGFGSLEIGETEWAALGANLHALRRAGVIEPVSKLS